MAEKEYIEREAVCGALNHIGGCDAEDEWSKGWDEAIDTALGMVEYISAADVAPVKHGKNETRMNPVDEFICSECGFTSREMSGYDAAEDVYYEFEPNFCPNCGADMREHT